MVYHVNDNITVYFEDGSTIICNIIDIDDITGQYICSALGTNSFYKQGDRIYIDPDSHKIEKTSKYTIEDEPSLFNINSEGVVFIGGDLVGTNMKGEREPYSLDWLDANAHWAVRQIGSAMRLKSLAQEGYDILAFVAYKSLEGGMSSNPSYIEALNREVEKKLKERNLKYEDVVDIVRNKGMDKIVSDEDSMFQYENEIPNENKLFKAILRYLDIDRKDVARNVASEDYYHKVGKIVGVAKFTGIQTGEDREIVHEAYPVNVILKNYVPVIPPIDFEEFLKDTKEGDLKQHKNPWFSMRNFNLKLSVRENANISYLIDLASDNDKMENDIIKQSDWDDANVDYSDLDKYDYYDDKGYPYFEGNDKDSPLFKRFRNQWQPDVDFLNKNKNVIIEHIPSGRIGVLDNNTFLGMYQVWFMDDSSGRVYAEMVDGKEVRKSKRNIPQKMLDYIKNIFKKPLIETEGYVKILDDESYDGKYYGRLGKIDAETIRTYKYGENYDGKRYKDKIYLGIVNTKNPDKVSPTTIYLYFPVDKLEPLGGARKILAIKDDIEMDNLNDLYSRLIRAKSPPGWSDWIEEQKASGMSDDESFGIAWKQYNKGTKSPSKTKKKSGYDNKWFDSVENEINFLEERIRQLENPLETENFRKTVYNGGEQIQKMIKEYMDRINELKKMEKKAGHYMIEDMDVDTDKKYSDIKPQYMDDEQILDWVFDMIGEERYHKEVQNDVTEAIRILEEEYNFKVRILSDYEWDESENWYKDIPGIETNSVKKIQSNIKKYARKFHWNFDKHKPQWSFDEKTGTIEKDEDAISRVAKRLKILI